MIFLIYAVIFFTEANRIYATVLDGIIVMLSVYMNIVQCQVRICFIEVTFLLRLFQEKIHGEVGSPSIIWGTTTRILIIFGVPPHKHKYLK